MAKNYILLGRSIDGYVYAIDNGWTNDKRMAKRMTGAEALERLEARVQRNREVEPDAMIGRLQIQRL